MKTLLKIYEEQEDFRKRLLDAFVVEITSWLSEVGGEFEIGDDTFERLRMVDGRVTVEACFEDGSPMGYFLDHLSLHQVAALVRVLTRLGVNVEED